MPGRYAVAEADLEGDHVGAHVANVGAHVADIRLNVAEGLEDVRELTNRFNVRNERGLLGGAKERLGHRAGSVQR